MIPVSASGRHHAFGPLKGGLRSARSGFNGLESNRRKTRDTHPEVKQMDVLEIDRPTREMSRKPEYDPEPAQNTAPGRALGHADAGTVSLRLQVLGVPSRPEFLTPTPGGTAGRVGDAETLWDRLRLSWQDRQTQRDLAPAHSPSRGW